MLTKLVTCQHTQTDKNVKTLPSEIRRTVAEFEKCAARVDDADSETVTLAVMGISFIAEETGPVPAHLQNALHRTRRMARRQA